MLHSFAIFVSEMVRSTVAHVLQTWSCTCNRSSRPSLIALFKLPVQSPCLQRPRNLVVGWQFQTTDNAGLGATTMEPIVVPNVSGVDELQGISPCYYTYWCRVRDPRCREDLLFLGSVDLTRIVEPLMGKYQRAPRSNTSRRILLGYTTRNQRRRQHRGE